MQNVSQDLSLPHKEELVLLSLDFKLADIGTREKLTLQEGEEKKLYADFSEKFQDLSLVLLATCNRTEIVACGKHLDYAKIWQWFCKAKGLELIPEYNLFCSQEAFLHLVSVCCGFESQFIGETQIFAQTKRAYAKATQMQNLHFILHFLFQQAFHYAKYIRNKTGINSDSISLSFTLKKIAESIFGKNLPEIGFIGAGEMIQTIAQDLAPASSYPTFFNRSLVKAEQLAQKYQGQSQELEKVWEVLDNCSIVVSCISLTEPLITHEFIKKLQKKRSYYPLLVLDLGVPRNCQTVIQDIAGVFYYDLEALQKIIDSHVSARKKIVSNSQDLMLAIKQKWYQALDQHQTKKSLRDKAIAYFDNSLPKDLEIKLQKQAKSNFLKSLNDSFFEQKTHKKIIKKTKYPHAFQLCRKILPCYNWKIESE